MKFKSQININFANITRYLLFLPPFLLPLYLQNKVDCISYDKKRISNQKLQILMKFKSQININFANITRYLLFLPPFLLPLHLQNKVDCVSYDKKRISNQKLQILMKFKSQININFANITRYLLFLPPFLLVITQLTVAKMRYGPARILSIFYYGS